MTPRWTTANPRTLVPRALVLALLGLALLVGCASIGPGGGDRPTLVRYERIFPGRAVEQQTIFTDGSVEMLHGEVRERLTLSAADLERIQSALRSEIPVGSPDDSPKRTLTLGDGTVIVAPRPEPGTVTELLERLLDRHSLA